MKQLTVSGVECVVVDAGAAPKTSIIWLHGLGADATDFVPIVPQLKKTLAIGARFVFPNAPIRPVTINGGMAMRAWYDIMGFDIARDQDVAGIQASVQSILALVEHESAVMAAQRVVLAGFSQGGAVALRAGLASSRPIAGILALSTYLLQADTLAQWARREPTDRLPKIWMGHGMHDPIVPVTMGKQATESLEGAGYSVAWNTWPMGHEVCQAEIDQLDGVLSSWSDPEVGQAHATVAS